MIFPISGDRKYSHKNYYYIFTNKKNNGGDYKMKNKSIKMAVLVISFFLVSLAPSVAKATTYGAWSERGVQNLAYSKNTLNWSVNSIYDITSMDAWQTHSGLFVSNNGYTKLNSSNVDNYYVNFSNIFTAGAVIFGQTIGYSRSVIDQIKANWNGSASWSYDI